MSVFADVPEQPEAKRLLDTALGEGPAHAYLFHGPPGVGKRTAAQALAGALLGDARRVVAGTHPDLRVIEALGDMIRIDEIRALHHDLHMRPFEGDRRVYLIFDAHRMNPDAAAALLKDLEERRLRDARARRGRARLAARHDPLPLPARPVPPPLAERGRGVARRPMRRHSARPRPRPCGESPAAASTVPHGCSTSCPRPARGVPDHRSRYVPRRGIRSSDAAASSPVPPARAARHVSTSRSSSTGSSSRLARPSSASGAQASAPSRTRSSPRSRTRRWITISFSSGPARKARSSTPTGSTTCARTSRAARRRTRRTRRLSCVRRGGRRRSSTSTRPSCSSRSSSGCAARSAPYRQSHGRAEPLRPGAGVRDRRSDCAGPRAEARARALALVRSGASVSPRAGHVEVPMTARGTRRQLHSAIRAEEAEIDRHAPVWRERALPDDHYGTKVRRAARSRSLGEAEVGPDRLLDRLGRRAEPADAVAAPRFVTRSPPRTPRRSSGSSRAGTGRSRSAARRARPCRAPSTRAACRSARRARRGAGSSRRGGRTRGPPCARAGALSRRDDHHAAVPLRRP